MASQKILIVDDSKTVRMQVRDMLPVGRFEILEAKDGMEGLDLICQEQPSLVLLDFFMPRLNGWEVVQKIQNQPKLCAIPVVMMSGRKEDVEQSVPELFDYFEFVSKPFEQRTLMEAIKLAMTKAKNRQPLLPVQAPVGVGGAMHLRRGDAVDPASHSEMQSLKAIVQQLQAQNLKLQADVDGLKKQVSQILAFVRQKLK